MESRLLQEQQNNMAWDDAPRDRDEMVGGCSHQVHIPPATYRSNVSIFFSGQPYVLLYLLVSNPVFPSILVVKATSIPQLKNCHLLHTRPHPTLHTSTIQLRLLVLSIRVR